MSFSELAAIEEPDRDELLRFVKEVKGFLLFALESSEQFDFLWDGDDDLREKAMETLRFDILEGAGLELEQAIPFILPGQLYLHGLSGRPLRFKFQVIGTIEKSYDVYQKADYIPPTLTKPSQTPSIGPWFKKMIDAIDAVLDSLISAAGGSGGIIKEFKDSLRAHA